MNHVLSSCTDELEISRIHTVNSLVTIVNSGLKNMPISPASDPTPTERFQWQLVLKDHIKKYLTQHFKTISPSVNQSTQELVYAERQRYILLQNANLERALLVNIDSVILQRFIIKSFTSKARSEMMNILRDYFHVDESAMPLTLLEDAVLPEIISFMWRVTASMNEEFYLRQNEDMLDPTANVPKIIREWLGCIYQFSNLVDAKAERLEKILISKVQKVAAWARAGAKTTQPLHIFQLSKDIRDTGTLYFNHLALLYVQKTYSFLALLKLGGIISNKNEVLKLVKVTNAMVLQRATIDSPDSKTKNDVKWLLILGIQRYGKNILGGGKTTFAELETAIDNIVQGPRDWASASAAYLFRRVNNILVSTTENSKAYKHVMMSLEFMPYLILNMYEPPVCEAMDKIAKLKFKRMGRDYDINVEINAELQIRYLRDLYIRNATDTCTKFTQITFANELKQKFMGQKYDFCDNYPVDAWNGIKQDCREKSRPKGILNLRKRPREEEQ